MDALGCGIGQHTADLAVGEQSAATGAMTGIVDDASNRLVSLVFGKEFVQELADGSSAGLMAELAVLPLVAIGGGATQGLPSLARMGMETATRSAISSRSHWAMAAIMV